MGQCCAQTFSGITAAQFSLLSEKGKAAGIDICGHCGTTERSGIVITWEYQPETQQLTIQCTHAPFYVSCNDVNIRIHKLIEASLA